MKAFTAGAADPVVAQAQFTLAENPALIRALQNAQSPQEANALMADAWKFAGYNKPGGENAARLATTQAYANSLAGGQTLPELASPRGSSMGSTAMQGGFGLNGIVGQGTSITGQASPTPGLASLSDQPTTLAAPLPQDQPAAGPYDGVASALKSIAGGQAQGQGQGQQKQQAKGGGMQLGGVETRPMTLQQARQQFDARKFYSMLPRGARA